MTRAKSKTPTWRTRVRQVTWGGLDSIEDSARKDLDAYAAGEVAHETAAMVLAAVLAEKAMRHAAVDDMRDNLARGWYETTGW